MSVASLRSIVEQSRGSFHSLQKVYRSAEDRAMAVELGIADFSSELGEFEDTAALVSQLDLVISVDTSIAHLAGMLGRPVWVLLPFMPDWRWMLQREDSPWYPTMRLFRQPRPGDWTTAIQNVTDALRTFVDQ